MRRDLATMELGRLIQTIFMGVTLAWSLNPASSARKTASAVWELVWPNLQAAPSQRTAKNPAKRRRNRS